MPGIRERENFLKDVKDRRLRSVSIKCRTACQSCCCRLKPETNLALMLCLVFYLYICLGGALFLLLEGQADPTTKPPVISDATQKIIASVSETDKNNIYNTCHKIYLEERRKKTRSQNLWNFLESTDFAYQVISGQGTTQTTRSLYTQGGKIAYIIFVFLGIPLYVLTLRATGQRLLIFVYSTIRFINTKIFSRQITRNIHIKALIFNVILFIVLLLAGMILFAVTQNWNLLDSMFYAISVVFTISGENVINQSVPLNSDKDKCLRIVYNFFSFVSLTVLASIAWSAHHFTRHMRFKAQNQQTTNNGDPRQRCPWVEVTRGQSSSPTKSTRERETDRESVC